MRWLLSVVAPNCRSEWLDKGHASDHHDVMRQQNLRIAACWLALTALTGCSSDSRDAIVDPTTTTSATFATAAGPSVEPMTTVPASSVVTSTTTGIALPETQSIGMEHGMLGYVVPADAVTDPTAQGTLPPFVIGYARWLTDCCLLRLAVQNIDPPMPDEEAAATFTANGLEWTVYDSGPRDGTQMVAKATNALGTVLISAQAGLSQQNTDPGVAQRLVEQVAKTTVLVPAK